MLRPLMLHRFQLTGRNALFARRDRIASFVNLAGRALGVCAASSYFEEAKQTIWQRWFQHVAQHVTQLVRLRLQASPLTLANVMLNFRFLFRA